MQLEACNASAKWLHVVHSLRGILEYTSFRCSLWVSLLILRVLQFIQVDLSSFKLISTSVVNVTYVRSITLSTY